MGKGKAWTETELLSLSMHYPHAFVDEYPDLFPGRSRNAVAGTAAKLGIAQQRKKVYLPRQYDEPVDGGYVTGLIDGEGSFMVSFVCRRGRWNFNPKFGVTLRIDDGPILKWLQKYLDCGRYSECTTTKSPRASLVVADLYSLMAKVIPHFDAYPLRAKKRDDYRLWKKMIELQATHFRRAWSDDVRREMTRLHRRLKAGRLLSTNHGGDR